MLRLSMQKQRAQFTKRLDERRELFGSVFAGDGESKIALGGSAGIFDERGEDALCDEAGFHARHFLCFSRDQRNNRRGCLGDAVAHFFEGGFHVLSVATQPQAQRFGGGEQVDGF